MGYGRRRDIINRKETENMPSPLNYNHSSIFDEDVKKHKGYSIAIRLNYKVLGVFCLEILLRYFFPKFFAEIFKI